MGRILVVGDEPDLLFVLWRIFTRAGHEVTQADNGVAALASVQRSPPDLVVTDIMMPAMDGVELIQALRADPATAAIPILVVSGDWRLAVDADAAVAKPYRRVELLEVAERLLQEGRGTHEAADDRAGGPGPDPRRWTATGLDGGPGRAPGRG